MGFKDWAKRAKAEMGITKEELAAAAIIEMGDNLQGEVTFKKVNRKMTKKMHDQLVEQDRKYGRGPGIVIPAKNIKVNILEQPIPKYHQLATAFEGKIQYTETRLQAKATLVAAKAQWKSTLAGVQKFTAKDFVELVFQDGSKTLDKPDRLVSVLNMDIKNAVAMIKKIDGYAPIQQNRRGAAKHVDLSFGSLKKRFKNRNK